MVPRGHPNFPATFDRRGRLYVSDSGNVEGERRPPAVRARRDAGSFLRAVRYANAAGASPTTVSLFLAESDTDRVLRFDLTATSRDLGAGRGVMPQAVGRLPDGLALDEAGDLYVACYASDEIWRISPSREKTCSPGTTTRSS